MIPMRLSDVGDLFIKASQHLQIQYNHDNVYYDAQAWKKHADARDNSVHSKIKHKPDYIAAKVAQNQIKLQSNLRKYKVPINKHVSIDETMVWRDFCIPTKTSSLPKRNMPVIWIPNDKETTTIIAAWYHNKLGLNFYSLLLPLSRQSLLVFDCFYSSQQLPFCTRVISTVCLICV